MSVLYIIDTMHIRIYIAVYDLHCSALAKFSGTSETRVSRRRGAAC